MKPNTPFSVPVLFLVFNRPELTSNVFDRIRTCRPNRLFIAADGPRQNVPGDIEKCSQVRKIVSNIDWPCKVETLFRDENMGCGRAVSSAITWFFKHVEAGIILEDDCLPDLSFFPYCEELLNYYRQNEKVLMISGCNLHQPPPATPYSYFFSRFTHIWGWATWRNRWEEYDFDLKSWAEHRHKRTLRKRMRKDAAVYWSHIFDRMYEGEIDTWDHQLSYLSFITDKANVIPAVNLVANIGFGTEATHTMNDKSVNSRIKTSAIAFPLQHPREVQIQSQADRRIQVQQFQKPYFAWRYRLSRLKRFVLHRKQIFGD